MAHVPAAAVVAFVLPQALVLDHPHHPFGVLAGGIPLLVGAHAAHVRGNVDRPQVDHASGSWSRKASRFRHGLSSSNGGGSGGAGEAHPQVSVPVSFVVSDHPHSDGGLSAGRTKRDHSGISWIRNDDGIWPVWVLSGTSSSGSISLNSSSARSRLISRFRSFFLPIDNSS